MENQLSIWQSVIIGGTGGAIAGITVFLVKNIVSEISYRIEAKSVNAWLKKTVSENRRFRSTRAIASHNNLTIDRVRYICSRHENIYMSTGPNEDLWGIKPRDNDIDIDSQNMTLG